MNSGHTCVPALDFLLRKRHGEQIISANGLQAINALPKNELVNLVAQNTRIAKKTLKGLTTAKLIKMRVAARGGTTYPMVYKRTILGGGICSVLIDIRNTQHLWNYLSPTTGYFTKDGSGKNNRQKTMQCFFRWMNLHPNNFEMNPPLSYYLSSFTTLTTTWSPA